MNERQVRGNLTSHKQSRYEAKKYSCDSCEYQADPYLLINIKNIMARNIPVTLVTTKQLREDL
jgi:hypothetical protein